MNSNSKYLDRSLIQLFLRVDTAHDFASANRTPQLITRDFINKMVGDG